MYTERNRRNYLPCLMVTFFALLGGLPACAEDISNDQVAEEGSEDAESGDDKAQGTCAMCGYATAIPEGACHLPTQNSGGGRALGTADLVCDSSTGAPISRQMAQLVMQSAEEILAQVTASNLRNYISAPQLAQLISRLTNLRLTAQRAMNPNTPVARADIAIVVNGVYFALSALLVCTAVATGDVTHWQEIYGFAYDVWKFFN